MTQEERDQRDRVDTAFLLQRPEFARFLWRVTQRARIFDRTADGSKDEAIAAIARRNLGLEILEMVEAGQPVPHPEGQPILTTLQVLREETNRQPGEKTHAKPRYDRTSELDEPDDPE